MRMSDWKFYVSIAVIGMLALVGYFVGFHKGYNAGYNPGLEASRPAVTPAPVPEPPPTRQPQTRVEAEYKAEQQEEDMAKFITFYYKKEGEFREISIVAENVTLIASDPGNHLTSKMSIVVGSSNTPRTIEVKGEVPAIADMLNRSMQEYRGNFDKIVVFPRSKEGGYVAMPFSRVEVVSDVGNGRSELELYPSGSVTVNVQARDVIVTLEETRKERYE